MYKRQDVCRLAGIDVERFKGLARRDQLPIVSPPPIGKTDEIRDHAKERGWNWFSAFDVFLIAVQEQLSREMGYLNGINSEDAAKVVWNNNGFLGDVFWNHSSAAASGRKDKWIGYLAFDGPPNRNNGGMNVSGSIADILNQIKDLDIPVARSFLVNADSALRAITLRAESSGIEFKTGQAALAAD